MTNSDDTLTDVLPGMIGLARIRGPFGWLIGIGQLLLGDASRYHHAFIVLDGATVAEAMPSGARLGRLDAYDRVAFGWAVPLTDLQRERIVAEAVGLVGTPYGFLDFLALGLTRLGVRWGRLERFVASNHTMICSQLVATAYQRAGVDLFPGGIPAWQVTPGDLANLFVERTAWHSAP